MALAFPLSLLLLLLPLRLKSNLELDLNLDNALHSVICKQVLISKNSKLELHPENQKDC